MGNGVFVQLVRSSRSYTVITKMRLLGLTDDFTLVLLGNTDIGAVGKLVRNERHPANRSNSQDSNNRVSGNVRKPSLGEGVTFLHLTGNGRQVHATRGDGHVGSTVA